jgi:hypothetical protein
MEYETAGDPITGLKWSRKTTGKVAEAISRELDISICANTVGRLLKEMGYSLKANEKKISVGCPEERNAQFERIAVVRKEFEQKGEPIISVDAKKKEMVGLFKNSGQVWTKESIKTFDHDFLSDAQGKAIPYGIYELLTNLGFVNIGISYNTADFAVNSIEKWWRLAGLKRYRQAKELLILADSGGSNNIRNRQWKKGIQEKLCDRYGLTVTVSHYPTGASKWNPIEHRLFSEISKNWAGRPLENYETILRYIATTQTTTGLRVKSYFDKKHYLKGIKIPDDEMKNLSIRYPDTLEKWNYTILPRF